MSRVTEFIKDNKLGTAFLTAGAIGLLVITGCSGFSIRDNVKFDVSKDMKMILDIEDRVSVNEAPYVREDFVGWFTRNLSKFDRDSESAEARAVFIESLINTGLDAAGASFPAGGLGLLALGGLGGLLTKGPGTGKREAAIGDRADAAGYARAIAELAMGADEDSDEGLG